MCGRYYLEDEIEDRRLAEQIKQATHVSAQICANMKSSGEIRPTDIAPVIAPSAAHQKIGAFPMQWGFNHPTKGMLVFNTRSETAEEKALFCTSINDRRCLIPASCYFEWHKIDKNKKDKYAFYAEDREPLYLAGLYIKTSDQQRLPCFSILTQDAATNIREIHPRMPVIVPFSRAEEWLSPDTGFSRDDSGFAGNSHTGTIEVGKRMCSLKKDKTSNYEMPERNKNGKQYLSSYQRQEISGQAG